MSGRRAGFVVCLVAAIALQIWSGAYRVERGLYSDDAAHFMNGLLIRDYLTTGLGQNPVSFAETYYRSYPKIAPLMWPPLFHVTLGLALLPGWPPGAAALLLVALALAWLAWRLHGIVRSMAGSLAGWAAVAILLTTQLVQAMSTVIMLDIVLAAVALEAAVWLARYAQSGSRRDAVVFGLLASAACLTKGNGVAVVLMPVMFVLLAWRVDLLRRSGLYVAAGLVLVLAVPILFVSARFDAAIGDFAPLTWALVVDRVQYYSVSLWHQLGPVLSILAVAGAALVLARHRTIAAVTSPIPHVLVALVVAAVLFHVVSPHQISTARYLTMAIAPLIALALFGLHALSAPIVSAARRSVLRPAVLIAVVVASMFTRPGLHAWLPLGFRDTVDYLVKEGRLPGQRVLVVSDEIGEGAFVTEVAVLALRPTPTIVRGSKLLASDDWMGRGFALNFSSPPAVLAELESLHVAYVLVDRSGSAGLPYFGQIEAIAAAEPVRFERIYSRPGNHSTGPRRSIEIYRVTSPTAGEPKPLELNLGNPSFGRWLKRAP